MSWAVIFTVTFIITAGISLWHLITDTERKAKSQVIHLLHLIMSFFMIAMAWYHFGSLGITIQVIIFGVFAIALLVIMAFKDNQRNDRFSSAVHLVLTFAMIWMVATMPLIMTEGTADHVVHAQHVHAITPRWAIVGTWSLAILSGISSLWFFRDIFGPINRISGHLCHGIMSLGMSIMLITMVY